MKIIDLNADVAEGCGQDESLLQIVSSANICCGLHAGSPKEMLHTLTLAKTYGVAIGAHPSFDDRINFGRKVMQIPKDELRALIRYQIGAICAVCEQVGVPLDYVKPHGALYNELAVDSDLAEIVVDELRAINDDLYVMGLAGGQFVDIAKNKGLGVISEAFADRQYNDDGTLVSRSQVGAVIDNDDAVAQALALAQSAAITSITGKPLTICADSICLHGDNAHAVTFARRIREALELQGIKIASRF